MSSANIDNNDIPQWKKDLIARLRSQNKRTATSGGGRQQQLVTVASGSSVQQPASVADEPFEEKCDVVTSCSSSLTGNMVQDRAWEWDEGYENGNGTANDSEEDLRYGPGIVNRLKNRYLSLAQRESSAKIRASILPMRKAASLENILDGDSNLIEASNDTDNRIFQKKTNGNIDTKNVPNRFRNATRGGELKRARSVETISRSQQDHEDTKNKRESLNEEILISSTAATEGNVIIPDKMGETALKPYSSRINRPKRIMPLMNEREKPPADVVNKAKLIFEKRPAQRTKQPQHTGEVAAKVATYKNIINQTKVSKKPPIKVKPVLTLDSKPKINGIQSPKIKPPLSPRSPKSPLPSPIPDISKIESKSYVNENGNSPTSLGEIPDLITSSPLPTVNSPSFRISTTEKFIKEEIRHSFVDNPSSQQEELFLATDSAIKPIIKPMTSTNSTVYNFSNKIINSQNEASIINDNILNTRTPANQPLKVEVNGIKDFIPQQPLKHPDQDNDIKSPPLPTVISKSLEPNLTSVEIKNRKNVEKSEPKTAISINSSEDIPNVIKVPKLKKKPIQTDCGNTMVFNFIGQDIPDYVHNDGRIKVMKPERPKAGEGGIILLPGASLGESFTDEEEEIMRSLEGPPSPCDVSFLNDNILIDGKSSLSQKTTKKAKLRISFVTEGPEVYEYPSENSLLMESPTSPIAQLRHTVPSLSGSSSLATYTPRSRAEEFQPGITRSLQQNDMPTKTEAFERQDILLEEFERPILFSAGANPDILF